MFGKTYLYVMAIGYDRLYKVGITRNIKKRFSMLGRANPRLKLVEAIEFKTRKKAAAVEVEIRKEFVDCLYEDRKEIYRLSYNDLRALIAEAYNANKPAALHSWWGEDPYAGSDF